MSAENLTKLLGRWEGYRTGTVGRFEAAEKETTAQVWIELLPESDRPMICSGCQQAVRQVHETVQR